eukprot:1255943-Amphidinium_carterae.1
MKTWGVGTVCSTMSSTPLSMEIEPERQAKQHVFQHMMPYFCLTRHKVPVSHKFSSTHDMRRSRVD